MMLKGCFTILVIAIMIGLLFVGGCASITRSFADWRMSANAVTQTQIEWDGRVTIAGIEADRDIQIAAINADVTKKTDWTYLAFYIARPLVWIVTILAISVIGLALLALIQKART